MSDQYVISDLAGPVDALYSDGFFPSLISLLDRNGVFSDPLIILYSSSKAPQILFHRYDEIDYKRHIEAYVETGIYCLDPFFQASVINNRQGLVSLDDVAPDHFRDTEFYLKYYENLKLEGELTLMVSLTPRACLHLSLAPKNQKQFPQAHGILRNLQSVVSALLKQQGNYLLQKEPKQALYHGIQQAMLHFGKSLLTAREQEVVQLILQGHSSQSVANRLNVAISTVKTHRKSAYQKLDISTQSELFYLFLDSVSLYEASTESDPLLQYQSPKT